MLRLACAVLAAAAVLTACSSGVDTTRSVSARTTVATAATGGDSGPVDPAFAEAKLRAVDPCGLLDTKLLGNVGTPGGKPSGDPFRGCQATVTVNGQQLSVTVTLGDAVPEWDRDAIPLDGMRVLEARQNTSCTDKAVTQSSPTRAIVVRTEAKGGGEPCATGRQVLSGVIARIRTAPPQIQAGSSVVAGTDPCTLIDKATVTSIVGPQPRLDSESLYDCAWRQNGITLEVYAKIGLDPAVPGFDTPPTPVDLGGVSAYRSDTSTAYPSCTVQWADRPLSQQRGEIVTVYVANGQKIAGFDTCGQAVAAGKIVAAKLPKS
ncbi:hypothetical protein ACFFS4_22675 [Kutzneria kofuensis]|uniref:DUF3558 domain-containing protein n=1 Tax=Kutzneria kofuensis TaxID=103725 RepID=A0A7W9KK17_9PSEU|nr:hypothetical protein [Kutzneria kofuensis]MBB5893877.1 hypothetical protein [Kutzneria kofuensis]